MSMVPGPGYTTVENLVAMTKHLHLSLFPEARGKWFFSRLELTRLLPTYTDGPLCIELSHSLGQRLTRSSITLYGKPAGRIYFSLVSE